MYQQTTLMVLAFIFCITGCEQKMSSPMSNTTKTISPSCLSWQNNCSLSINDHQLLVLFGVKNIEPEEAFNIYLQGDDTIKLRSITGHAEGVNMYMGKIPLFFTRSPSNPQKFTANSQFGSCSEPQMTWRLVLNISYIDEQEQLVEVMRFVDIKVNNFN
jgi:hypothetical protein